MDTGQCGRGESELTGSLSPLLGEALDLLCGPAHGRAPLLLLGQHGHQGLGEQIRVLPVTHHLLEDGRETVCGVSGPQQ